MANENESSKRMDLSSGYELADAYYGHDVRVYLGTGVVLSGILKLRQGKFILLQNKFKSRPAMINLDDVSSIS